MFIGVYLCGSGVFFFGSLAAVFFLTKGTTTVMELRQRLLRYAAIALPSAIIGLAAFLGLSWVTGLLRLGEAGNFNLPGDYIEFGILGWGILLIGMVGLLSPAWALLLISNNKRQKN